MGFEGIVIGAGAFLIIGLMHPVVIKTEYYVGTRAWPAFLVPGLILGRPVDEVRGAGERAFCSGADVRSIRTRVLAGEPWLSFFEVEYTLNSLVARYPKPYVAFMSGIDMGGGLGLSAARLLRALPG